MCCKHTYYHYLHFFYEIPLVLTMLSPICFWVARISLFSLLRKNLQQSFGWREIFVFVTVFVLVFITVFVIIFVFVFVVRIVATKFEVVRASELWLAVAQHKLQLATYSRIRYLFHYRWWLQINFSLPMDCHQNKVLAGFEATLRHLVWWILTYICKEGERNTLQWTFLNFQGEVIYSFIRNTS